MYIYKQKNIVDFESFMKLNERLTKLEQSKKSSSNVQSLLQQNIKKYNDLTSKYNDVVNENKKIRKCIIDIDKNKELLKLRYNQLSNKYQTSLQTIKTKTATIQNLERMLSQQMNQVNSMQRWQQQMTMMNKSFQKR